MASRPTLVFSGICAVFAAAVAFFVVEREGDPALRVQEVQKQISGTNALIERHTVRLKPNTTTKTSEPTRALFEMEKPDGTKITIEAPASATAQQLSSTADFMISSGWTELVLADSAWVEAQRWWTDLTWRNQRSAELMALARFPSKPGAVSSSEWDSRQQLATFAVEELSTHALRRGGYAFGTLVAVFLFLMVVLAACGWLWRALLARMREVSQALRGEQKNDA